ncbi:MAG: hypothetical protein QS748_10775 [Candidatus Endonucleobacter bathymodioli]|uniref:Uncharacterized protein n=1 Tax=Candidatus Endonucleibacter bathymodioli TaxID=539814 RepID=A0AA90SN63_9GAMM|nr:hypothetical protein [Candidatus Endonucleobacter bathymodioli]
MVTRRGSEDVSSVLNDLGDPDVAALSLFLDKLYYAPLHYAEYSKLNNFGFGCIVFCLDKNESCKYLMPVLLDDKNRLVQMQERDGWEIKTNYMDVNLPISTIMTMLCRDYKNDIQSLKEKGLVYGSNERTDDEGQQASSKFEELFELLLNDINVSDHSWTHGRSVYAFAENEWKHCDGYQVQYQLNKSERSKTVGLLDMIFPTNEEGYIKDHQHKKNFHFGNCGITVHFLAK